MRIQKVFLACLAPGVLGLACLAGCTGGAGGLQPSAVPGTSVPGPQPPAANLAIRAAARPAASRFYTVFFAGQAKDSWQLLAPAAKREITLRVWQGVHSACKPGSAVRPPVIRAVTVFGDAAIVTAVPADQSSRRHTVRDVFNYVDGRWGYQPADISIYFHGSVAADAAAAKRAGLCDGWKSF